MKKFIAAGALILASTFAAHAEYPDRKIEGVIMWGAGGSTDTVMRSIAPLVEDRLDENFVLVNRTGGAGAISVHYVDQKQADGYTVLLGAENPQLFRVLDLADIDYSDMVPVSIIARGVPMIVARPDAPYDNLSEMVAFAKANPGEIRWGSTGVGGLSFMIAAMLGNQTELEMTQVPYVGDSPAMTALLGGALDVIGLTVGAASEQVRAGKMKVITIFDVKENAIAPDIQPVIADFPDLEASLPWGPFYGAFVKKGTPPEAVSILSEAFLAAGQDPAFTKMMQDRGNIVTNIAGDEAVAFLDNYRRVSAWLVQDAGIAKVSPETLGIPRP